MNVESRHSAVPGAPPPAPQGPVAALRRRLHRSRNGLWFIPAIFVLLGAVYLAQATEVFTTRQNLLNLAAQTTPILIVSIGQMLVVVIRGLDLSVGAVMSLTTALLVIDAPPELTLPLVFGVAIAIGLANGVMAVLLNVHPIIATLATMSVVQGITLLVRPVAGGQVPRGIRDLASGTILGLPAPVVICAVVLLVAWALIHRSRFGLHLFAIGGGHTAGTFGLAEKRQQILAYVLCSVFAALAGIFVAARIGSGDPNVGAQFAIDSITAVALGGTQLAGGIGSLGGTAFGALFIAVLGNGMNLLNVSPFIQTIVKGSILLMVVAMQPRKTVGL